MQHRLLLLCGIVFTAMSLLSLRAEALVSPVGISLFPPLELPPRHSSVVGARLNAFIGIHESVHGFDLGVAGNMTDKAFGGLQIAGLYNANKGHSTIIGLQFAGLGNWDLGGSDIYGIQATLGLNTDRGKSTLVGLGIGLLGNWSQGTIVGVQIGIYNQAKNVDGLQLGLCNMTETLHGVQIGLVNISKKGALPFFPIVNVGI